MGFQEVILDTPALLSSEHQLHETQLSTGLCSRPAKEHLQSPCSVRDREAGRAEQCLCKMPMAINLLPPQVHPSTDKPTPDPIAQPHTPPNSPHPMLRQETHIIHQPLGHECLRVGKGTLILHAGMRETPTELSLLARTGIAPLNSHPTGFTASPILVIFFSLSDSAQE